VGPIVAEPAAPFRKQRVVLDRLEDLAQVVLDRGQEARRELRVRCARIEEGGRRGTEAEGRERVGELDRSRLTILLVEGEPHRDPHPESLRELQTASLVVEQIAVVKRLQA